MTSRPLVLAAIAFVFSFDVAAAQSVTDFVDYKGGTYTQNFNTLPDPGATSVNTSSTPVINGITYTLPAANGVPYALDDTTIGSGGNSIGGAAMAGWYGGDVLSDRFGATYGDQTTGGLLDFGPASGGDRALGLIATSTTGSSYMGVAIKNDTGATITAVNISFTGELWKQGTAAKTFLYSYTVDNSGTLNLISAATSPSAATLGTLTATPTSVAAVDGTNPANQTPVALTNITLATALQPGGILWFTAQIADATGSGQGFGIDNFNFSGVGAPGITTQPASQTVNAGGSATLTVAAAGATAYQWQLNGENISGATNSTLTLSNIGTTQAGDYTALVTIGSATVASNAATVTVTTNTHPINISARAFTGSGQQVLVGGFYISGTTSETVLIRAVGPTLSQYGVTAPLATPVLTLYDGNAAVIAANTGWGNASVPGSSTVQAGIQPASAAVFTQTYAFPLPANSADSAMVVTLPPGGYTAQVSSASGTGVALVEIYDVP